MKKIFIVAAVAVVVLSSCSYFREDVKKDAVARVGEKYLLQSDIKSIIGDKVSREDSISIVSHYVNNWALKELFNEKAKINLPDEKIIQFEELINQYRLDLYTNAYKELLVNRSMDTVVTRQEMDTFYVHNRDNFKLNEDLLKLRYLCVSKDYSNLKEVTQKFKRFDEGDQQELKSQVLQFKFYSFNDSVWVKASDVISKIPVLNSENKDKYLINSQFFELTDSLGVYLVAVNDVLKRTDPAPLEYVLPTVKQIILNKRKLEFIRKLEKEIIDEAVQKKQYEIYE